MTNTKLPALIDLLDDPDEEIYQQIKNKILEFGLEAIPHLENAWESSLNSELQKRIENLIHFLQFDNVKKDLIEWNKNENNILIDGALIISRFKYPELKKELIEKEIEKISKDVWLELNENLTPLEKVKVLNHIFFNIYGFSGNKFDFHSPENSLINIVLETKKGNPLSLSIIYSSIANKLNLPIYGINLPEHFILGYKNENTLSFIDKNKILFYINTFSKGTIFSKKEIEQYIKELKLDDNETYYNICSNTDIIIRMLHNLINSYKKINYQDKIEELEILLGCLI